jgi:hypothetical protein
MGGKNHQPCRTYLVNSTKLSRAMSMAFASLELANVSLEDVIIAELTGGRGNINFIVFNLQESEGHLQKMSESLADLCKQMRMESFQDLPSLKTVNLQALGAQACKENLHQSSAEWDEAAKTMLTRGFWGMISIFEQRISSLVMMTKELSQRVSNTSAAAAEGTLHLCLEENGEQNFKREFAKLYTAWASFQQLFLASSLISTELWYQFNGFGSLMNRPSQLCAAS